MVQQPPPNCHDTKTRFLQLPTTILLSACSTQVSTVNDYHCGMKVVHLFILFLLPTPTSKALVYQLFRAFYDIIITLPTSILGGNPVLSHTKKKWGGHRFCYTAKSGPDPNCICSSFLSSKVLRPLLPFVSNKGGVVACATSCALSQI